MIPSVAIPANTAVSDIREHSQMRAVIDSAVISEPVSALLSTTRAAYPADPGARRPVIFLAIVKYVTPPKVVVPAALVANNVRPGKNPK